MKIYIATKLENWKQHNDVRDALIRRGHEITYDWTTHGPVWGAGPERIREVQQLELEGVANADVTVVLANDREKGIPTGRGTHVEIGLALAFGRPVYIVGNRDVIKGASPDTCAFYHHELVTCFSSTDELIEFLTLRPATDADWQEWADGRLG